MDLIRQAELERLKRLKQQKELAQDEYDALRRDVIERSREGAVVEAGPWDLKVWETETRYFSGDEMVRLVGPEEAERLRMKLNPKVTTSVKVIPSQGGPAR